MNSISIAMCTYNGARYLEAQLASLQAQTWPPDELVVCDDASTDGTWALLESFAARAPFLVRLVRNPQNLGYVHNFEQAIGLCQHDLVFLCDQDDIWHPEKLAKVKRCFAEDPAVGLVLHGFERIDGEGAPYPTLPDWHGPRQVSTDGLAQDVARHSLEAFVVPRHKAWCGCMSAFKREFLDVVLPIFPGKGHDDWIQKMIAPLTETRFVPEALIQYRIHPHNANNHEAQNRGWALKWLKLKTRWRNAWRGHSKRRFYGLILERLGQSGRPIRHPQLLALYRRYTRWGWG